jgi:hypothetical protein
MCFFAIWSRETLILLYPSPQRYRNSSHATVHISSLPREYAVRLCASFGITPADSAGGSTSSPRRPAAPAAAREFATLQQLQPSADAAPGCHQQTRARSRWALQAASEQALACRASPCTCTMLASCGNFCQSCNSCCKHVPPVGARPIPTGGHTATQQLTLARSCPPWWPGAESPG